MYLFLSSAAGTDAAAGGGSMIIMMVVLIAVFYFLMIRPENKRKKEAEAMRNALKVGDNTVSYTHLDVYKRQALWIPAASPSSFPPSGICGRSEERCCSGTFRRSR